MSTEGPSADRNPTDAPDVAELTADPVAPSPDLSEPILPDDDGDGEALGWNAVPPEPVFDPGLETYLDYSSQKRKAEQERAAVAEAEAIALAKAAGERARAAAAAEAAEQDDDDELVAVPKKKKKKKKNGGEGKKKDGEGKEKAGEGKTAAAGTADDEYDEYSGPYESLAKVDLPYQGVSGKSEAELKKARKLIKSDAPLAVIMSELDPALPVQSAGSKAIRTEPRRRMIAVVLAAFLGFLGLHNFYLGHTKTAVLQLTLSVVSMGLLAVISLLWAWYEAASLVLSSERRWRVDGLGIPLV